MVPLDPEKGGGNGWVRQTNAAVRKKGRTVLVLLDNKKEPKGFVESSHNDSDDDNKGYEYG